MRLMDLPAGFLRQPGPPRSFDRPEIVRALRACRADGGEGLRIKRRMGTSGGKALSSEVLEEIRMRSHTKYLTMNVPSRMDFVNITDEVQAAVAESGVAEGLCLVNPMHITASVFINDDEPGLHRDYERFFESLVPHDPIGQWRHNDTGEENADAHIKRQLMGREVVVAITNGR